MACSTSSPYGHQFQSWLPISIHLPANVLGLQGTRPKFLDPYTHMGDPEETPDRPSSSCWGVSQRMEDLSVSVSISPKLSLSNKQILKKEGEKNNTSKGRGIKYLTSIGLTN